MSYYTTKLFLYSDFLPALPEHSEKGSLAVENSDEILPHIRRLLDKRYKWAAVAVSQVC